MDEIGILVMGHGSKLPYNKEIVESVAKNLAKKHDIRVQTAYMGMNEPSIEEGLRMLAETGVKRIVAVPIFLAHGVHTLKDIPRVLGVSEGKTESITVNGNTVEVSYAGPLGADERIADIAFSRVQEVL
ncbi:Sirohydrochlorin cobaltochelatase [Candidatus Methanoperedenaceae archaeon GB50]|nr:Sirohydrochlorin cobaltochelatase [Candidatus Methanoperedenaceae archaeon GB37]CAD7770067.1 Sirohydrochlorin cobaltochelatase [Candidatus Methanoperedenaceae archaeon GB50]CAD7778010.1 MAG: Sirohydrochlorin cobaltochelatase [Candidatus Methanoperedenaceae archaeon GB50]